MINQTRGDSFVSQEALDFWHAKLEAKRAMRKIEGRIFKENYTKIGISRAEVARISGISATTIAKFERGQYIRSWAIVRKSLANAIRLKCHEMLLTAIDSMNPNLLNEMLG